MEKTLDELRQDVADQRALLDNLEAQQHALLVKRYDACRACVVAMVALKAFETKGKRSTTHDKEGK